MFVSWKYISYKHFLETLQVPPDITPPPHPPFLSLPKHPYKVE